MFAVHPVPPDLARYVACIWTLAAEASDAPQPPIAPDGCCEWILHVGDPPQALREGTWRTQPREFLFGQLREPLVLRSERGLRCVAIRFHPYAAAPLLRVSGSELEPEELTFSRLARFHGLCDSYSMPRVIAALRSLVREARAADPLAAAACRELASPDPARIAAVARKLEVSPRTLERRFFDAVGLTPKRYARIARMQRGLACLAAPGARPIEVAHHLGFADQAHFTRELVALAGMRPSEALRAA